MSQKQKILSHLKSNPKDFTFDEAESLLKTLGYKRLNKGKTSGAYSFGSYDSMPYILLNYTDTLKDVFTITPHPVCLSNSLIIL